MQVGIHEAKTRLSQLIPAALAGEDVVIVKGGTPLVRLVPVRAPEGERPLGLCRETVHLYGDVTEPLPDEETAPFWPAQP